MGTIADFALTAQKALRHASPERLSQRANSQGVAHLGRQVMEPAASLRSTLPPWLVVNTLCPVRDASRAIQP